jgi:hypothetical protein
MENDIDAWCEEDGLVPYHVQARFEAITSNKRMVNVMLRMIEAKLSCTP